MGKSQLKRRRSRKDRLGRKFAIGAVAIVVIITCFLIYSFLNSQTPTNGSSELKAAIVDHLSDSYPNQTFVETSKAILRNAGFKVYYYSKAAVDVNFYRNLPNQGFDVIIFRVHSAVNEESDLVVFFTSEPFDDFKARTTYLSDFLTDPPRLVRAMIYEGADPYFGITPSFIDSMRGEFDDAFIIMMGCSGLDPTHTSMAEALVNRGVKVYISWDGLVSPSHTDQATTQLLRLLVIEKQTVRNAVTQTNNEVGVDPTYKSKLSWYPLKTENHTILDGVSNVASNTDTQISPTQFPRKREEKI